MSVKNNISGESPSRQPKQIKITFTNVGKSLKITKIAWGYAMLLFCSVMVAIHENAEMLFLGRERGCVFLP